MTLQELDDTLTKMGLDLTSEAGRATRDRILASYGATLVNSKKSHCQNCWYREHNRCYETCQFHDVNDDPLKAAYTYLDRPNDVNLTTFVCMFVIPTYEKETGNTGVMKRIADKIKRLETRKRSKK